MDKRCDSCKYAEWEYIDAYRSGFWSICGCNLPVDVELPDGVTEFDDDWGDETDCPFWEELNIEEEE